jgi:hypothetical protein
MTLKEFKNFIKNKPDDYIFKTKLTNVFSWRGSYDEVAFSLSKEECTKQELLDIINKAYARTFYGYKGGEYSYDDDTEVHFEEDYVSYTDGAYFTEYYNDFFRKTMTYLELQIFD